MTKKYLLTLFLALFSYLSAIAAVSLADAKTKVQNYVSNTLKLQNCDIYYNTTNETQVALFRREPMKPTTSSWLFFVDQKPGAGWAHPVNVIFVAKSNGAIKCISSDMPLIKMDSWKRLNKQSNSTVYYNNNNAYATNSIGPNIKYDSNSFISNRVFAQNVVSNHNSYAVIISGGISNRYNYVRYWNDCALTYQMLVYVYGFDKDKIYTCIADGPGGTNNVCLGLDVNGSPVTTTAPLDLDRDGIPDIENAYAARRNQISHVFNLLAQRMNSESNLYVFTTDHGDRYDGLCLWHYKDDEWNEPNQYMTPAQLNEELAKLTKRKSISILMAQCYSGAFANAIHLDNSTICTAASDDEMSAGSEKYDDFVYHFTMALSKSIAKADKDNDSNISFKEAFDYAYENDQYRINGWLDKIQGTNEYVRRYDYPQYWSDGCFGEKQHVDGALQDYVSLCCSAGMDGTNRASKKITSTASISRANINYQSYGNIVLKKGFKVSNGGKFKGKILACNSSNVSTRANSLRSLTVDPEEFEINSDITDFDDAISEIEGVEIYPNPTDGLLYIRANSAIKKLIVTDLTGKVILDTDAGSNEETLDLSSNAQGFYLLHVITEDDSYVEKILLK